MSKVAKQVIVILFLLLIVSILFALSAVSQKSALESAKSKLDTELNQYKEKEKKLAQDNQKLSDQLKEAQGVQSKLQKQFTDVNEKIASLTSERDEWKSKVDGLKRERDELIAKLQEKPEPPVIQQAPVAEMAPKQAEMVSADQDSYWAQILKEKASLEIKLKELQTQLSSGGMASEELKKKVSDLELELGQLKNEKEELDRKVKYSEDLTNTLSIELAREKNDKRYIADKFDKIKEESLALRAQVKELTTAKIALEKNIAKLSGDKSAAEQRLATTESVIQSRIDEVLDIKKSLDKKLQGSSSSSTSKEVELPAIIVNAPGTTAGAADNSQKAPQAAGLNGRIVNINNDNNFVITDLGENSGIRIGDKLSVYRGSKYIAGLEVIQVRKDISAADIKQKGAKIEVGDTVR